MHQRSGNTTPHFPSDYDEQILATIPMYAAFHTQTMEAVKAHQPKPALWLDTGCGTGSLIKKCADCFPQTRFILADPAADMLAVAREKLADDADRITFLPAVSSQQLNAFLKEKPDVITAIQAHHYLSAAEREQATQVCFDLLKENGIFITFENIAPFTEDGVRIGKSLWGNFQLQSGKTKEQVETHLDRYGNDYHPITVEQHLALYRSCGFRVVELLWYSYMQAGFYCIK
ncbi:MAG: class I SAM-dependent methyltransferase [Oscillospiraceae bacterium]